MVTRGSSRRNGTIPFSSLTPVILNSLPGETTPVQQETEGVGRRRPRYPVYVELAARLHSFRRWPFYGPTVEDLAHAGFFGERHNGDSVCCYYCGVVLNNWDRNDDPWVEHAWWFPQCRFLKETRGERFIHLVQRQSQEEDRFHRRMHTAVVENDTDMTQEVKAQIKAILEAKFTEDDVLLAMKKFMEQKGIFYVYIALKYHRYLELS
ncbi:unnamed protein product [Mytilus coruscus]|uniref:BIRC7_8 n=1 Tax=Mytilus coruscus TaxID=42192 RepID=A0A6J8EPQ8_MYTCO|nr:unnamed protein product [Mytilus coruscus]